MKKLVLFVTILIISFATANASAKSKDPYTVINAEELQKLQRENSNLVIIDSRGEKYFDGKMIVGATNLATHDTDEESLAKLSKNKDNKLVFYCVNTSCPASGLAAYKANAAGYTHIYVYEDGIEDWIKKALPLNS